MVKLGNGSHFGVSFGTPSHRSLTNVNKRLATSLAYLFAGKDNTAGAKSDPQNIIKTELDKIMTNIGFGLSGIATETTVVDSVGQRLVLRIDNYLGGGGQRRVTIYCPFWIINSTEHALIGCPACTLS